MCRNTDCIKCQIFKNEKKMKSTKLITRNLHLCGQTFGKVVPKNLKGRSKSSQEWLTRQLADPFVEKAKMLNYRWDLIYTNFTVYYIEILIDQVPKCLQTSRNQSKT